MSFLQIYQFLKDPIGVLPLAAAGTRSQLRPLLRRPAAGVRVRRDPGAARSEFACPAIVAGMMGDFLAAEEGNAGAVCAIAPIAVAHSFSIGLDNDGGAAAGAGAGRPVIIDGSNRIATIAFLRYAALCGVPNPGDFAKLQVHCREYGLGPIHFADLLSMLQMLWGEERQDLAELLRTSPRLERFATARHVPVLVTEESNFLTECLMDGVEGGLQPVHQAIFATDDRLVPLPSKMQRHGREKGFQAMPISC